MRMLWKNINTEKTGDALKGILAKVHTQKMRNLEVAQN